MKPDSFKGYTIGDNTNKHLAKHPYRLDNEKLMYPFTRSSSKRAWSTSASIRVCFPRRSRRIFPTCWAIPTWLTSARRQRIGLS